MEIAYFLPLILLLETTLPHGVHALVNFESAAALTSITRQNNGDTFQATGIDCNPDACVGLSSGTAAIAEESPEGSCTCQCHRHLPAFREDLQICVDDIHECVLAPFVSGSMSQQIPFVFLPLKGQIIHPSKEISFTGVLTPICAVSGAKFLTGNGWVDLRNPVDTDVPFRLYRDEGRTFLQWEGEAELRNRMGGRLVLVHLMCRELGTNQELPQDLQPVFSPCVAFRVVGSPTKYSSNISEVVFTPDSQSSVDSQGNGLSVSEIVAIGICSILLGLIYVASIFLYLHLRKKRRDAEKSAIRRDEPSLADAEEGIIKSNPLLGLERHFGPIDNSCTDSTSSDTDVTPDILQHHDDRKKSITSALIHSYHYDHHAPYLTSIETCPQDSASIECLPEENVSIIETLEGREDRPENVRAIGTVRKKLYFNPAYFEPHLLLTPPPAAVEFLTKIREVITIAKQKMATKRFTPNLLGIPEEESSFSVEQTYEYSQQSTRRDSMISLKRENSRRRMCVGGCPGCEPPQDFVKLPEFSPALVACESCSSTAAENKQRSIRKWLEDIPVIKPANVDDPAPSKNKRIRSPNQVAYFSPPHSRALSPKPSSERAASSTIYSDPTPSIISHPPSKPRYRNRRPPRKPVVKPKTPPPPLPTAKPTQNNYETIKSTTLPPPDMIHEAMAVDRNEEVRIPTITKKKMNAVINEFASQHGIDAPPALNAEESSPSPALSDRRQVDYEMDSLERNTARRTASETSSQPSPSLSTALPMDEELTMRNEIINTNTGTMTISKLNLGLLQQPDEDDYELIVLKKAEGNHPIYHLPELLQRGSEYSLVSEVYVNNGYNYGSAPSSDNSNSSTLEKNPPTPMVRYEKNQPGHLLIEVADCADNYIRVEDSDSFEPDTLDRKPNRLSLRRSSENDAGDFVDSLERPNQILLRTTGTFKNDPTPPSGNPKVPQSNFNRNLGSLREIYEAKIRKSIQGKFNNANEAMPWGLTDLSYEGRILTLEERHSKRQRRIPPDVIPPQPIDDSNSSPMPIYEQPKPPRKVIQVDVAKPPLPPKNSLNHKKKAQRLFDSDNQSESDGNNEKSDASILKSFIHTNDVLFKNGINNQFIFQAATVTPPNLLFKKHQKKDINWTFKPSPLQKYLEKPDDPGYLSTDSNESVPPRKKRQQQQQQQQAKGDAEAGSETDESLCDGHSESGAESIETHSVFFDSFRKPAAFLSGSLDSGVDSDLMKTGGFSSNAVLDDGASSDSENMSFKTVVTTRKY